VLGLDRIGLLGPAETPDQPAEVGVHGDAGDAEGVAEDHVGGLATHAGELDQVLHTRRHLPAVTGDQGCGQLEQGLGLGPEEAERADDALQVLARRRCHRRRVGIGGEQSGTHGVDPAVGRLGTEDGDDEELERVVEVQLAARVGVGLRQHAVDLACASDQ
jgi:hypothetical protein